MHTYSRAEVRPLFSPSVAHYYKGMLVQIPLFLHELSGSVAEVHKVLTTRYANEQFVEVVALDAVVAPDGYLDPTACNDTNRLQIMVLGNEEQVLLVARYDNLGKGASGAAIQNMNLMIGIDEAIGL